MIEVRGISKAYGKKENRFMVLDNVSFSIPEGASVAIVGKSGSGKSSLVHAMSGLSRPELGEVLIDGEDILELGPREIDQFRLRMMGFIFQSFFVQTSQTCFENVSLPLEILGVPQHQRSVLVDEALEAVGLADKRSVMAYHLSGGQKQRLAVARAIVNRPKILFADEPTGNLDSLTGHAIEKLLFWCNKMYHITLIIVTHDHELAAKCDMQIEIRDGKVASITNKGQKMPVPGVVDPKAVMEQQLAAADKRKVIHSIRRHLGVRAVNDRPTVIPVRHPSHGKPKDRSHL